MHNLCFNFENHSIISRSPNNLQHAVPTLIDQHNRMAFPQVTSIHTYKCSTLFSSVILSVHNSTKYSTGAPPAVITRVNTADKLSTVFAIHATSKIRLREKPNSKQNLYNNLFLRFIFT